MDRIDLIKHLAVIFAGLLVLFWTLYFMVSLLKFALGLILFMITLVVGEMLLSENQEKLSVKDQSNPFRFISQISGELVIVCLFAFSLLIIFFVPTIKGEIFVDWSVLELPTIVRLIAAFGMNFFPGYLILAILERHRLGKLFTLITSYFMSLFVLSMTGFVSGLVRGIIDELFLNAFLVVCSALLVAYFFKRLLGFKSRFEDTGDSATYSSRLEKLPALLLGLTIAFLSIWLLWMYSNIGFFIGVPGSDMWRSHGYAQTFLDYRAFTWLNIPWWFNLYLACFIFISGAPSANAFITLYPLIALSTLSFYFMVSSLLKDKKMASLATLAYTIFSGPAWLYALYLRNFVFDVSYGDWTYIISTTGDKFFYQGWYPPFVSGFNAAVIAYTALWWMIYATFRLNLRKKFNFILLSLVIAMSYLLHGVDPVIFLVFLIAYLLFAFSTQSVDGKKRVRLAALSVVAALMIVSVVDLSLTPQYEYFKSFSMSFIQTLPIKQEKYYYFGSPSFYTLVLVSGLLVVLTYLKFIDTKLMKLYHFATQKLKQKYASSIKRRSVEIFFYLYGLTLIVWVILLPSISAFASAGIGWIPWYAYPAIGGVPFFLGLVGAVLLVLRWRNVEGKVKEILAFSAIAIILLFFFGQMISFVNETFFYTGFWERRTLGYMQPMVSILLAYAVITLFGRVHVEKPRIKNLVKVGGVALLTSVIMIASVSSTLMAGDYDFRMFFSTSVTKEELEALTYLHYSLPNGVPTAYINRYTGLNYIRAFASDKYSFNPYLWLGQFYRSPTSTLLAIRQADSKYLYVNRVRDLKDLNNNLYLQQLIKVLPVAFNNSEVTIYSIPPLHAPSRLSSLGVITPKETMGSSYDAYVLWFFSLMMSDYSYSVVTNASDAVFLDAVESVIMSFDPQPIREDVGQLPDWVSNGGHLIVSNTNQFGMFAELFGLTSKVSLVNCDSVDNWRVAYGERWERGQILVENTVKIEGNASLRLRNNQSSWEDWIYTALTPWNLSRYDYLGIWVYGTGGGPIWYLYLTDSNGNDNYYRYDLSVFDSESRTYVPSFTGWKQILIPLRQYYGNLDLSAIKELRIVTGSQLPVNILIDEIFALEESGKGQPTVMVDGILGSVRIDLPNTEVKGLSLSDDVRVIANYTQNDIPIAPFAIQRDFGSGKVTYLNINLLYQSVLSESSGFTSPHEIFTKILELIGLEGPP